MAQSKITYLVSIDSEDEFEGEWNDNLVIVADDEDEAKTLAADWVEEHRGVSAVGLTEAYAWGGESAVIAVRNLDQIEG